MSAKYSYTNFNPHKLSLHNIDRQAIDFVPVSSLVLDIGCATGFMGAYLKKHKNCQVFGLEIRSEEIKIAKKYLDDVIKGDIVESKSISAILKKTKQKKFDVILATSVIEHVTNPSQALKNMLRLLKTNGLIIMSTPNIAHWSMRWDLFRGRFNYTEYGILDNTHFHLFTADNFKDLFLNEGLKIEKFLIDAEGGGYPRISLILAKFFPKIFAYQMLIVARKTN